MADYLDIKSLMLNNVLQMKKLKANHKGFITMIVMIVLILVAIIWFAYYRVSNAR